jgi:CheY-like chemotaxis protein
MIRILIVEDSPGVRYLLEEFLKALDGVELLTAGTGPEALAKLPMNSPADAATSVDLILMDIRMPEMSGIDACRLIKSNAFAGDIPVIMVTAHDDEEHLSNAFDAGAMDYIKKPVNRVELLSRVRSALELKREMDSRKRAYAELEKTVAEL